ncbi:hypothetical protein [Brevundimonas sp.]|uniref:hypothetical protein n=1 Tax=Brevundimonas sp. TaxID=1871086 RepID=UPI003D0B848D
MSLAAPIIAALIGLVALQDAVPDSWELTERPGIAMASVRYAGGQALAIRCAGGQVETFLAGAEAPAEPGRLELSFDDEAFQPQSWLSLQVGGVIHSMDPLLTARRLAASRRVSIRVPASDGRSLRYDLDLPQSADAITTVLERCGAPTEDPRDALPHVFLTEGWDRLPQPIYPDRAIRDHMSGIVGLNCVTGTGGRVEDCRTDMVAPGGYGFEASAERATRDARLPVDATTAPGRVVTFVIRFNLPR